MISLPGFVLPLSGALSSVVHLSSSSISRQILILPVECFPSLSVIPPCSIPPFPRPFRLPPLGACRCAPQWPPGHSQSPQVRPGSIHNANLTVIKEATMSARPMADLPVSLGVVMDGLLMDEKDSQHVSLVAGK